ncbi:MAG TPA: VOC family protein [Candidatus Babeliales bacterium]|nr:VOC family protein [Candidatus Babeliales bacterium]
MNNPAPLKVGMLILMQHNLDQAVEFYRQLGLELKFHLKGKWAEFQIGDVKLGLCPTEAEPFQRHTGIVLEVPDLHQFYTSRKAAGLNFPWGEPKVAPHGIMVGVEDPSGNILDLYQPTPEKVLELARQAPQTAASCCKNRSANLHGAADDQTGCCQHTDGTKADCC